jgi:hypothetical protein
MVFSKTGRAYPDLSAQGQGFQVVVGGSVESVAGTSASSPVWFFYYYLLFLANYIYQRPLLESSRFSMTSVLLRERPHWDSLTLCSTPMLPLASTISHLDQIPDAEQQVSHISTYEMAD